MSFPLLNSGFGNQQKQSLQDNIQASVLLRYNSDIHYITLIKNVVALVGGEFSIIHTLFYAFHAVALI